MINYITLLAIGALSSLKTHVNTCLVVYDVQYLRIIFAVQWFQLWKHSFPYMPCLVYFNTTSQNISNFGMHTNSLKILVEICTYQLYVWLLLDVPAKFQVPKIYIWIGTQKCHVTTLMKQQPGNNLETIRICDIISKF